MEEQPTTRQRRPTLSVPESLHAALEADAEALEIPITQVASMLLYEALDRARARRYAPFRLPEGYGWDAFGKPYTADENVPTKDAQVTPIRKARKAAR